VFNVYSQEIDPTNMMPPPNQSLAPGQVEPLPVERVSSSIPKGGTEGTWLYPSPQMFYNSLVRKNKADGVEVKDVNMVVAIHNEMNERTWSQLKEWEADHKAFVGPVSHFCLPRLGGVRA
jgi:cytochrome c heme-lyase